MVKNKSPFSEEDVVAYIAKNPDVLKNHPDLLLKCVDLLNPSENKDILDQKKVVDLSPALAAKAREEARQLNLANKSMLTVATENMLSWKRLHHATLGLLASVDLEGLRNVISNEFPSIFELRTCSLVIEEESDPKAIKATGLATQPAAKIAAALENQTIFLGMPNKAGISLVGDNIASIALIRVPDRLPDPVSSCCLLLVGKNSKSFQPELGRDLLIFLAEMIGVTLAARFEHSVN